MKDKNSVIIMYDVTNYETFEDAKQWVFDVRRSMDAEPGIMLLGNKLDVAENVPHRRQVKRTEAREFAGE